MNSSPLVSFVHEISQARILKSVDAGIQPRLIQGIQRRDGLGDYLYVN